MVLFFVIAITVFMMAPLLGLMSQFDVKNFAEVLIDPTFAKSLLVTLETSVGGAFLSVVIALFFVRQFATYNWKGKRLQRLILLIPYLIPNFVLATSFVIAWNPTTGLLNGIFKFPGGLYGKIGMTALFAISHAPVAFLLLEEKLRRIDSSLKEAARISGASPTQIFLKIEVPLLIPTMVSALGLCFALSISAFAIPAWIGAPARTYPLTYKIYQAIQLGGLDGLTEASSFALVLILLSFLPSALSLLVTGKEKKYVLLSGKSSKAPQQKQQIKTFLGFQSLFFLTQMVFWIAPMTCLLLSTITKSGCLQEKGLTCLNDLGLSRYYYVLFELTETKEALRGSLLYGAIASFLIVALSIVTLFILSKKSNALRIVGLIYSISLATPGAIIALGLIVVYSGRFGANLYNTAGIVLLAFIIKHTSLAFQPIKTGFANISTSLLEAAELSGGNRVSILKSIIFPILRAELLGSFFLVFIPIIGELTMSIFLVSASYKNIGTVLFDLQDYADQASAGALAVLLILLVLALNECAYRMSGKKLGY